MALDVYVGSLGRYYEGEWHSVDERPVSGAGGRRRTRAASDPERLRRLYWACRRGMRELDILLGGFLARRYAALPAAQRQVFIWHELEDKTFREMEEETGVPLKTLISRKHYAVQHLRKRLRRLPRL